jgi:hypothetical protein
VVVVEERSTESAFVSLLKNRKVEALV